MEDGKVEERKSIKQKGKRVSWGATTVFQGQQRYILSASFLQCQASFVIVLPPGKLLGTLKSVGTRVLHACFYNQAL